MGKFSLTPTLTGVAFLGRLSLLALLVSACGGGGGYGNNGYSSKSSYDSSNYSSTSSYLSSSVESSSSSLSSSSVPATSSSLTSSSSSSSSADSSSLASSSAMAVVPIAKSVTTMGGTYVAAEGMVQVLLSSDSTLSTAMEDRSNKTLYVFDSDAPGSSACTSDACITAWPPLLAENNEIAVTPPLSIITRDDGHFQFALRDKPLYFFVGDNAAGDVSGEGVNDAWHVASYQPVLLNEPQLNSADGDYLVASGKVLVGVPDGDNSAFKAEPQVREGFSLYTFDNDTTDVSSCSGTCLENWPPLLADTDDQAQAPYSIIERSMGTAGTARQWAYQGKPLYFFLGDSTAGATTGKAIAKWHLARPEPVQTLASTTLGSYIGAAGLVKTAALQDAVEVTSSAPRDGFALYTFDNDSAGVSNCSAGCLTNWPALMANEGAEATAPYSLIQRASGEWQWALNGMPLYFFAGDTQAGETNGEGVNGTWHVARIAPVAVSVHPQKAALLIAHGNLVNASGDADTSHQDFTLYTFDKDPLDQATCNGGCLITWPALYAATDAKAFGDFTLVTRSTGEKQWAYKGKPLYFYLGDSAAGDVNGEYTDWTIARP